jgi:protein-S-isoprenylcysteine O-methyltransferase Ste14
MAGVYIGVRRMRHLTTSVMLGVPEVARGGKAGKLLTGGIYGQVRHPRYLEIGFVLAAVALFVNYLAVYVLLAAYVPVIYLVALLEEHELRERFGEAYEQYCSEVPRFVPRLWRKNS